MKRNSRILPCNCKSVKQDEEHGEKRREHFGKHTRTGMVWVCSVCRAVKTVTVDTALPKQ